MSISFKNGDLFKEPVDALVNTVNCVGVMGKGVAREFKIRWPENYTAYRTLCDTKALRPGIVFVYELQSLLSSDTPKYLVNFPTKDHWKAKSKIDYISRGLDALVEKICELDIRSIAMPPLGCGNGGLDWSEVKPLIVEKLEKLGDVNVIVFNPKEQTEEPEFNTTSLGMTFERALVLKLLIDLSDIFDEQYDRLTLQKLIYLLQAMGVKLNLNFNKYLHGPYSEALRKAFISLEKYKMVEGFARSRQVTVTPAGYATAEEFLREWKHDKADDVIGKLSRLIEGYESPYGLELLSSVHWLVSKKSVNSIKEIESELFVENPSERNVFRTPEIEQAYSRLAEDGVLPKLSEMDIDKLQSVKRI